MRKRILSFLLCAALMTGSLSVLAATEGESSKAERMAMNERLIFEAKIAQTSDSISIQNIKAVQDFAGNKYTVVECSPTGYYIYHNESGTFVEYAPDSPSPYKDLEGELYYGGPTGYFNLQENALTHTITDEDYSLAYMEDYALSSTEQANTLIEGADEQVLNFVKSNANARSSANAVIPAAAGNIYVSNYSYFMNMRQNFGYYLPSGSNGICGYIAANLLLQYWHNRSNIFTQAQAASYMTPSALQNATLTKSLRFYGTKDIVNASELSSIISRFCSDSGISCYVGWNAGHLGIYNEIVYNNRPLIIIGHLPNIRIDDGSTVAHCVVVYGVEDGGYFYITHYGWDNYPCVYVSATFLNSTNNTVFVP